MTIDSDGLSAMRGHHETWADESVTRVRVIVVQRILGWSDRKVGNAVGVPAAQVGRFRRGAHIQGAHTRDLFERWAWGYVHPTGWHASDPFRCDGCGRKWYECSTDPRPCACPECRTLHPCEC